MDENSLHKLHIVEIRQSEELRSHVLVLRDKHRRSLEIPIGHCESTAIQMGLDQQPAERPQTHDLLLTLATRLQATVERVVIDDFSADTFYARLILSSADGTTSLDCRPSDGIALAIRADAPIFASDAVITAGNR